MKRLFKVDMIEDIDPTSPVPLKAQMRLLLNKAGMRFEDDGKPSAITNINPVPLGVVKWYDQAHSPGIRIYSQELDEKPSRSGGVNENP